METLLLKRAAALKQPLAALALFAAAAVWLLLPGPARTPAAAADCIRSQVARGNARLEERLNALRRRYRHLVDLHRRARPLPQLFPGEALVKVEKGRLAWYHGTITVSPVGIPEAEGGWGLERRGDVIFLLVDLGESLRYVTPLMGVKNNMLTRGFTFPLAQYNLLILRNPSKKSSLEYQYDEHGGLHILTAALAATEGRLVLSLKVLQEDVQRYYQGLRRLQAGIPAGLGLILILLWLTKRKNILARLAVPVVALILVLGAANLASAWGRGSVLIQVGHVSLVSLFQVMILALWLLVPARLAASRSWHPLAAVMVADLGLAAGIWAGYALLQRVFFYFGTFTVSERYLALLLTLFILHILPFPILWRLRFPRRGKWIAVMIIIQAAALGLVAWLLPGMRLPFGVMVLAVPAALLPRPPILRRVLVAGLVALSILSLTTSRDEANKREFITGNLRHIFLNQGNYAKLIAREIVHEVNMEGGDLSLFFHQSSDSILRDLWRETLAARESIPSSITVLSPDMQVLHQFSHQIPYVPAGEGRFFPVWAVEDVRARLYGREIALARASISVYREGRHLGYIVIQVLNSPELILRQAEEASIFALDPRLGRTPMNYIKLNREREVLENPGQVNLQDVSGLFRRTDRWVDFIHNNARYSGYVFEGGGDAIMIYYRMPSALRRLAGWIRILLFILLILALPGMRRAFTMPLRRLTHSFSVRVFAILVLIALLTGVVFSIFSLNFHGDSLKQERMSSTLARGRTARNIVNGMMGGERELTRNQVFFLSRMIEADVTVFHDGEREFTSDIRRILRGMVPEYMDSRVLDVLTRRNQKFVMRRREKGNTVYFRNGRYVFRLDFPLPWDGVSGGGDSYDDFVTAMIFFLGLIGLGVAVFFRDRILEPIRTLNQGMAEVESGRLPRLHPLPREDELQALYRGFNNMIRGIETQRRNISEISRMKTLVDLGRRVAHEVKNPLTPIKLSAEQIRRSLRDKRPGYEDTILRSVDFIIDETEHLKKVSYGFLDLSRLDAIEARDFPLGELLEEEVMHFRQVYPGIRFELHLHPRNLNVHLDPVKIRQMVKNILSNSVEAMGEGPGEISVTMEAREDHVQLDFVDNGSGMDLREIEQVFEMDYSTKESGTGLGMFIIHRIIDLHGGRMELESRRRRGTRIRIRLPLRAESRG